MNVSPSKNGYSSIPDVDLEQPEQPVAAPEAEEPTEEEELKLLAVKYPEANEYEAKFLGALDKAIAKYSEPKIALPKLPPKCEQLGSSSSDSIPAFLNSLRAPTVALIATLGAGVQVLAMNNPIYEALYPYLSCVLLFISSIPSLRERFMQRFEALFAVIEHEPKEAEAKIEEFSNKAIKQLDDAESRMDSALKPIQAKLDKVTELESMLRIVDPSIDIPDISDIEEAFDGATGKIKSALEKVNDCCGVCVDKNIPEPIKSTKNMSNYFFYPFLAGVLIFQLVGVYVSETVKNSVVDPVAETDISTSTSEVPVEDSLEDPEFRSQFMLLIVTPLVNYLGTILEMSIAFALSQVSLIVKEMNTRIENIETDVNKEFKKRTGPIFDMVFKEGMGTVRSKTLKLIKDIEKIEGPLKKAEEMAEMAKLKKLQEEAAARAKEEAEKKLQEAKEAAARKLEEAKEEAERKAREAQEKAEQAKGALNSIRKLGGKKRFGF